MLGRRNSDGCFAIRDQAPSIAPNALVDLGSEVNPAEGSVRRLCEVCPSLAIYRVKVPRVNNDRNLVPKKAGRELNEPDGQVVFANG
jgi:hypothetical protein